MAATFLEFQISANPGLSLWVSVFDVDGTTVLYGHALPPLSSGAVNYYWAATVDLADNVNPATPYRAKVRIAATQLAFNAASDVYPIESFWAKGGIASGDVAALTAAGGGAGDGDTDVDHNTGGADALAYKTAGGAGIAGATVRAFLKSDYDAGTFTVRGEAKTDFNGRWTNKMRLFHGSVYTIEFGEAGEFGPDTVEVTV